MVIFFWALSREGPLVRDFVGDLVDHVEGLGDLFVDLVVDLFVDLVVDFVEVRALCVRLDGAPRVRLLCSDRV